jgi:hypothetical protein
VRAALLLQLRSGSIFAPSFGSRPQTFVDDLAQQLLYALVQRGLFDLYEFASTDVVERIVHKIVAKLALPQPAVKPKQ